MMKFLVLLFIAVISDTATAATVLNYCSANYVRCCITEFLILANPDRGFDFSEERINNTCMTAQNTFYCMDDLKGMCENEELLEAVDASHSAMSELCSVDTPRYKAMKDQKCLHDSSEAVKECSANAPELHLEGLTADCCKYMRFKNCALSSIKTNCSEEVAKFADNYIVDVAGLGYEQVCMDHFYHCSSASALTSSVWLFIISSVLHLNLRNCRMFALSYGRSIIIASKWDHFKAEKSRQIFATMSNVKTFSKLAKTDDSSVNRDAIKKSKPTTRSSAVEPNHKVQAIVDGYPTSLWKNHRKFNNLYLADEDIAENVAKFICDGKEDVFIFEANPGPGILTKELLKYSLKIRVFEREAAFISVLKRLQEQYEASLDVVEEDITLLPKLETKAKFYDSEYIQAIVKDIEKKHWKDGIALKFVAVISSSRTINFMRYLLARLPSLGSLFTYGRCQFFLFLTDMEYSRMMAKPKGNMSTYRDVTVLYNLFFEVESLKKLPVEAFVPLVNSNKKKSPQNIYFVRLTPKPNLLDMVHSPHLLPELYFFIRHHFMKRKSYVIPTLEQWIPWCGPKFIKKGMRVFTRFGDLSPSQILQLFQQFSSLPEYEDSPFRAAVEHFFEHHHTL